MWEFDYICKRMTIQHIKRLWRCMYEWVWIMAQTASHTTLIQCPWAKHHSWASLCFTILSLLDTQPVVSCRSYSDALRHVFSCFFVWVKTMCSDSKKQKKICNRSVKWNLSLRLLFVHVRSTPLGNRTHVRCCVPKQGPPEKHSTAPNLLVLDYDYKDYRLSLKWEDVLVMVFFYVVCLYVCTVTNSKWHRFIKRYICQELQIKHYILNDLNVII